MNLGFETCGCGGRVHFATKHFERRFGKKIAKLTLDNGGVCPHRANGGCVFCHPDSFLPYQIDEFGKLQSVTVQMERGLPRLKKRYRTDSFFAYFSRETSAAAPLEKLREEWTAAFAEPSMIGVIVSTRPDYIDESKIELLASLSSKWGKLAWIEFGLQSSNDATLKRINRGHDAAAFAGAVEMTRSFGVPAGAHTILGLPGETLDDMIKTHRFAAACKVSTVKIHHFQVLKNTRAEIMRADGLAPVFSSLDEYLDVLIEVLRVIPYEIGIQRVFTDSRGGLLVAPRLFDRKEDALGALSAKMESKDVRQGDNRLK